MLELRSASKIYRRGPHAVTAAHELSHPFAPGQFVVVHGPSGSGKSTLLLMLGGMLPPDRGQVLRHHDDIYAWPARRRNRYRQTTVGFVFQRFCLLPYLTVYDNIRLPLALARRDGQRQRILDLAEQLGVSAKLHHRPAELSVGEAQRAAVARALATDPDVLLADEPTGNLDPANSRVVAHCLATQARRGKLVVMVTHNPDLLDLGTHRLHLHAGRITDDAPSPSPHRAGHD